VQTHPFDDLATLSIALRADIGAGQMNMEEIMSNTPSLVALIAAGALTVSPVLAQSQDTIDPDDPTPVQELPADGELDPLEESEGQADECRESLAIFAAQLEQEGFWVTGWGTAGYGPGAELMSDPAAPDAGAEAQTDAAPLAGGAAANHWGFDQFVGMQGYQSPRGQIQQLYGAARVFAEQNNQEGCDYVLGQVSATYERYRAQLSDAGLQPQQIIDWRQEQIALAEPVTDAAEGGRLTIDAIRGSDVRTRADENLGSVNDVIVHPQTGELRYIIVARGGFLGFGEELVAVPWQAFATVPGLNSLVLDVEPEHLSAAPAIEGNFWIDDEAYGALVQRADDYWFQ